MKSLRYVSSACLLVLGCSLLSCSDSTPTAVSNSDGLSSELRVTATTKDAVSGRAESTIRVDFPDGVTAGDWDAYRSLIVPLATGLEEPITFDVTVDDDDNVSYLLGGVPKAAADIKGPVGKFYIRLSAEKGWVRACINQNVRHLGFMVSLQGQKKEIVNMHLASWKEAKTRWFGIYNSASKSKWCKKFSLPDYEKIRGKISEGLIAAGIAAATAYVIAQIVTPAVIAGLALA